MSYRHLFACFLIFLAGHCLGQQADSISLKIRLDTLSNKLWVEQEFRLVNHSPHDLDYIYLNAWVNAYTGRLTELNRVKLEQRNGALHFSEKEDRGAVINPVFMNHKDESLKFGFEEREFIRIELNQPWKKDELLILSAIYEIKIPFDQVTHYGKSKEGDYLLKYFFMHPAPTDQNGNWQLQHYKDFEEPLTRPAHYQLSINFPKNYRLYTDLEGQGSQWHGSNIEFFRLYLTRNLKKTHSFFDQSSGLKTEFGFEIKPDDLASIDSLIPSQLAFLQEHLGHLPTNKLFVSNKTKKEQNFFGVDEIDIWIGTLKPFTPTERNALKLFQMLSYEYIDRMFLTDKIKDHWLKNGLQYYLMMKYTDRYFPKLKLVGHLADNFRLLGMRPFNFFDAAQLKMNDRYKMLFLYMAIQSFDQPINTPFDELSKMNQMVVSGFKTGFTFYYIDKFLGDGEFYNMIKNFSLKYHGQKVGQQDFKKYLTENSHSDLSWFFDDYIDLKDRINFKLIRSEEKNDELKVKIKNKTGFEGPFQLTALKNRKQLISQWFQNSNKKFEVSIPAADYDLLALNPDFLFPEIAERDNYMRTRGLFRNMKKVQFRLYPDVENPKFAQIFVNPQLRWNNYDKFLVGARFQNQSIIRRPFKWSVSPKWSTGQKVLTGSLSVQNTFYPQRSIFQFIRIGAVGQYEHYAKDLSYLKWSVYGISELKKNYRSNLSQGFILSYDRLDKEVAPGLSRTEEDKYGLLNLTYYYSKPDYIHEFRTSATFQSTEVFNKIFAEAHYRWRFAPRKQLGVRLFTGVFLNNESATDYFDFGLSRVSDYAFNLNMLGRSESSGVLSQQYFLSEAGFKSHFERGVNAWVVAMNFEIPVWKMVDIYADTAVFQNKNSASHFIYDTGIRIKIIPEFLELYFPIQSSNGFEPGLTKYGQRIRFTLDLNFSSLINHLRRGWF